MPHPLALLARLVLAFVLTYMLGFERELRGSPAGDRTFALIGVAGAVIGMIAVNGAQGVLSGAATGVGFIGAALVFRPGISQSGVLHGVTTAAAILGAAVVGAAAGQGHLLLACGATALMLVILEVEHLPGLRLLDAGRYSARFRNDGDRGRDNHT
jgi:putative Mg2+ transporter-C (MgtC) family protein